LTGKTGMARDVLTALARMTKVDPSPENSKKRKSSSRQKGRAQKPPKRPARAKKGSAAPDPAISLGRLERTRRLLLAALRVWELKRRVRD